MVRRRESLPQRNLGLSRSDEQLGIRYIEVSAEELNVVPFRGGLRITVVEKNSRASLEGIRVGDILVGLHIYEVTTDDQLHWVLRKLANQNDKKPRFYFVRNGETLFGHFDLNSDPEQSKTEPAEPQISAAAAEAIELTSVAPEPTDREFDMEAKVDQRVPPRNRSREIGGTIGAGFLRGSASASRSRYARPEE